MRRQAGLGMAFARISGILDRLRFEHATVNPVSGAIQLRPLPGDPDTVIEIGQIGSRCLTGLDGSPQKPPRIVPGR
jgi:hypothetical protein